MQLHNTHTTDEEQTLGDAEISLQRGLAEQVALAAANVRLLERVKSILAVVDRLGAMG